MRTYFNVNRHINPTNVCVASCKLCAFGRKPDGPGAYTMALDEALRVAGENWSEAVTEFHIVGGLHPDLTFDYYLDLLRGLKQRFPSVHLKGFTAVEIGYFSHVTRLSILEVLERLKDAGLDSLPGGGAEIFAPAVRRVICDHKIGAHTWLKVHRLAHELGMHTNATMLYGHIESAEDRVDHLLQLRKLQDETHGFQTYIPLAFHPANTELGKLVEHDETSGFMDLKNVAVARLLLDNFPHIKAYWIMMTPRVAQVALRFGADDLDGTVVEEKIYHDAGANDSPSNDPPAAYPPDSRGGLRTLRARHALPPRHPHGNQRHRAGVTLGEFLLPPSSKPLNVTRPCWPFLCRWQLPFGYARAAPAVEELNPYRGVNQYHRGPRRCPCARFCGGVARSSLSTARLPSHSWLSKKAGRL